MFGLGAHIRSAVVVTIALLVVTCGAYPLVVWAAGRALFPAKANGSLVQRHDQVVGSSLIAQPFADAKYFHPRPSAAGSGYDAASSSGSNWGPLNQKLIDAVRERIAKYREENGVPEGTPVPADAVTASGSGLDPHISPENARLQLPRVAKARNLAVSQVRQLVEEHTEGRTLGILGEPRVNIVTLNLALDNGTT